MCGIFSYESHNAVSSNIKCNSKIKTKINFKRAMPTKQLRDLYGKLGKAHKNFFLPL